MVFVFDKYRVMRCNGLVLLIRLTIAYLARNGIARSFFLSQILSILRGVSVISPQQDWSSSAPQSTMECTSLCSAPARSKASGRGR